MTKKKKADQKAIEEIEALGGVSVKALSRKEGDGFGFYASFNHAGRDRHFAEKGNGPNGWPALMAKVETYFAQEIPQ